MAILSLPGVKGDVSAEGRLIVTPAEDCDWICWGLEYRQQAGADLLLTTPDLTVTGFAGTSTTRSGSVSTNVYRGTLTTTPVAVCGTGPQPHIGVYRVYARLWASGLGVRARFTFRDGDGPLSSLAWETPPAEDAWVELDLGVITISEKTLGTQRWTGQVEAYTDTPGDTLDVDYLILMPAGEGFGRARKTLRYETSTTFTARDEFDQSAGALAGKTLPTGGTWVGAGDADDFTVNATTKKAQRVGTSDAAGLNNGRFAIAGTTVLTASAVQADLTSTATSTQSGIPGVLARYTDVNNFMLAALQPSVVTPGLISVAVMKRVASVEATIWNQTIPLTLVGGIHRTRLQVDAAGRWALWIFPSTGSAGVPIASGYDSVLATGGTLASGKVGIWDANYGATATTRTFDNFMAFAPPSDAVCFANQSVEFRSDGDALREDSSGTVYGRPQEYRGAPFFIPPAGDENRTSRVVVMCRKNDVATMPNPTVAVSHQVQALYTPRMLYLPR